MRSTQWVLFFSGTITFRGGNEWAEKMEVVGGGYDVLGKYHVTPEVQTTIKRGKGTGNATGNSS
mgnify:CR=1 FL=1